MRALILGGRDHIGGNSTFLTHRTTHLLLDAGYRINLKHPVPVFSHILRYTTYQGLNAVLISHMHTDHYGSLIHLIDSGYRGKVLMSDFSQKLFSYILKNPYIDNRLPPEHKEFIKNRYSVVSNLVEGIPAMQDFSCGDATVRLISNDHMTGSVSMYVELGGRKILYTGDVGPDPISTHQGITDIDLMIFDASLLYSSRSMSLLEEKQKLIQKILNLTKVLGRFLTIPINPMGDQQTVLQILNQIALQNGRVQNVVLYGPSAEVNQLLHADFSYLNILHRNYVVAEEVLLAPSPSGGGHVAKFINNKLSTSLFTSPVLSNKDVLHEEEIIGMDDLELMEAVNEGRGFHIPISLHASRSELFAFLRKLSPDVTVPMKIYEKPAMRTWLTKKWNEIVPWGRIIFPKIGEEIEI